MHFGVPERGVFPLVSMLGDLVPVTVGAALAFKRRGKPRVALTFFGDGAFNCGDTHEGLNLAGALDVPAVFVAQSNRVAYSTVSARRRCATRTWRSGSRAATRFRAPASTAPTRSPCTALVGAAVERARAGEGPQAVEALTVRHRRPRGARRRPLHGPALLQEYGTKRDPVERLAARMLADGTSADELAGAARGGGGRGRGRAGRGRGGAAARPRRRCSTASTRRACAPAGAEHGCRRSWSTTSGSWRRRPRRPGTRSRGWPGWNAGSHGRRARAPATRPGTSCGGSARAGRR